MKKAQEHLEVVVGTHYNLTQAQIVRAKGVLGGNAMPL